MSNAVRSLVLIAILILVSTGPAPGQDSTTVDPAKAAAIRRLLEVTEIGRLFTAGMELGLEAERAASPETPAIFWDELIQKARDDVDEFLAMLVPAYARLLTLEEVEGLVAFYSTPLGRRLVEVQEDLTAAMGRLGEQWGMMIAAEVMLDLAKRGVIIR